MTCISEKCLLHEMMGADFLAFLETSPDTKAALLNMCRKRLFKKAVKKYSLEHNRGFTNEDLMKAFELADTNKCGILDYEDVKKLMHAMDPSIPESEIIELMKFIDVDMDGKLSFRVSACESMFVPFCTFRPAVVSYALFFVSGYYAFCFATGI